MRGTRLVLIFGALAVAISCSDSDVLGPVSNDFPVAPPDGPSDPSALISDAVHDAGNSHFFWLAPMVPNPDAFNGDFDAGQSPTVRICDLSDCGNLEIASYSMDTGPGSETVRVVPEDEHYIVNWNTDEFGVTAGPTYRISVSAGGTMLGYADIQLASNGNEVKNITTQETIGLKDGRTLPIKFRIEEGAVFVISSADGGTIEALGGTAMLEVPAGALTGDTGITVQSEPPTGEEIVTVDLGPDGLTFDTPVTVTLAYDESALGGIDENDLALTTFDDGEWVIVNGFVRDPATNTISAPFYHFSKASVGPAATAVVCSSDGNPHTFDTVQQGLDAVMDGGTVSICGETQVADSVSVAKPVTFEGRGGARPVIRTTTARAGFWVEGVPSGLVAFGGIDFENQSPRASGNTYSIWARAVFDQISVADATFTIDPAATGGFALQGENAAPGARVEVTNSAFSGGLIGLNANFVPETDVSGSSFGSHQNNSVILHATSGRFENNTIGPDCGAARCLVLWGPTGDVTVVGNTFVETRTDLTPAHRTVWARTGISARVEDNDFNGCGAGECFFASGGADVEVVNNRFNIDSSHGTTFAVYGDGSVGGTPTLLVTDNVITGDGVGQNGFATVYGAIEVEAGATLTALRNTITNTASGIAGYNGGIVEDARDNVIDNVRQGIGVYGGSQVNARFNDITNASQLDIDIPDSDPALSNLTCNFWGDANGPDSVTPNVPSGLYTPFAADSIAGKGATSCTAGAFAIDGTGGTINAAGGDVVLDIPAGALGSQVAIVVDPVTSPPGDQGLVFGAVYDFQPDGTTFSTPATLTLAYDEANLPGGLAEAELTILTEENGVWIELPSTVDDVANTVTAAIDGFSGKGVGGKVATVDVTPSSDTIDEGATTQLTATPKDAAGNPMNRNVTWTSLDPGIATVDNTGLVAGVAAGNAMIEAASGSAVGTASVVIASPGLSQIAFNSWRDGDQEIFGMLPDGSSQTNLTDNFDNDTFHQWSPDGSRIAFVSGRDGNDEIYVMNANGSGVIRLTTSLGNDWYPQWSPDGSRIAFESTRDGNREVYVMNTDGTGQLNLTGNSGSDEGPRWSPDGSRIAFVSNRDGNHEVYVMNADGTGQLNLSQDPSDYDRSPAWAPDGTRIAFDSYRNGGYEIYVVGPDGSGLVNLTNTPGNDFDAHWSPDGSRIAFRSDRTIYQSGGTYVLDDEIFVMNADGSGQSNLTNTLGIDYQPAWSPDGTQLLFGSYRDGNLEIYVMNADGSGQVNLTNDPSSDTNPAWRP